MNNDKEMSSSNTTPFNNRNNKVLNNEKLSKYNAMRQLGPRNNSLNRERMENNESLPIKNNDNKRIIPEKKQSDKIKEQPEKNNINGKLRNPFGPKNRLNNTASNLKDKFNTNNNLKDDAAKKGAEALKKSANPYAKAAGYAASYLQKRKDKKKQKEEKEKDDSNKDEDNKEEDKNKEDESLVSENKVAVKKIAPIVMTILPLVIIILIILSLIMPVLNAYSWFQSLFHHKSDNPESYYIYNENQQKLYEQEKAFNDAIVGSKDGSVKGIIKEYQDKYGVTIDKYLLVATITYRYSAGNSENIYTSDGNEDINDEELNSKLEELDNSDSNENNNNSENGIDYKDAEKKIKTVASLMITKNGNSYTTDKEVGGNFYNTLIDSKFLKDYYKKILKDDSYESRKKLVDKIFDYAEGARLMDDEDEHPVNGGVIGDTTIVHVQTCKLKYTLKEVNGMEVFDNPPWNEGTDYPDYLSMRDYIKGLIDREIGTGRDYIEAIKAQAIAGFTYIINDSRSGFDLKSGEMYFPGGTCRQATCSPTYGCTSYQEPTSSNPNMLTTIIGENSQKGNTHEPTIGTKYEEVLEEVLNEVFGKVMVKKGVTTATFSGSSDTIHPSYYDSCSPGTCFSQKDAMTDARNGMTYTQILAKYYSKYEYDIIDITEGLYYQSSGGNISGTSNLSTSYHYYQSDSPWGNQKLCGVDGNISGNGCNITSAAMVISLLKNQRITPDILNNRQSENQYCNPSSRSQMIQTFGQMYGLNVQIVNKGNNIEVHNMVEKIASGNYAAVARIAPNSGRYSTSSGHYVAVVGARSQNGKDQLLIWDPATKSSIRDNVWVDVNELVKYLQPNYSFILMGR